MDPSEMRAFASNLGVFPQRSPKGIYDQIVCPPCEVKFGTWDTYAIELYRSIPNITAVLSNVKTPEGKIRKNYSNPQLFDYHKLKLFVLSLLWRSHASTNRAFSAVRLGLAFEKQIREMINNDDPGSVEDFPFYIH
jgi:hypothetical protein